MSAISKFFDKIDNLDRRILMWFVVIAVSLPYFVSVGLPVPMEPWAQDAIDYMVSVPEGSTVLLDCSAALRVITELETGMKATGYYFAQKHFKIVGTCFYPDGVLEWRSYIEPEFIKAGYVYGEDYVFLGYIPGEATAVDRLAKSIRGVVTVDEKGTPLDDIPMMADIDTWEDFEFVLAFGSGWGPSAFVTYWYLPYGSNVIPFSHMYGLTGYLNNWMAGWVPGTICGVRGSAEWSNYLGLRSTAAITLDSVGLGHVIMIIMVILGNISYLYTKYVENPEKREGGNV